MPSILGATTKLIATVTIVLAVAYAFFLSMLGPLEPNPDAPTFADVEKRLQAGETSGYSDEERQAIEDRMRELVEQHRSQQNQ